METLFLRLNYKGHIWMSSEIEHMIDANATFKIMSCSDVPLYIVNVLHSYNSSTIMILRKLRSHDMSCHKQVEETLQVSSINHN